MMHDAMMKHAQTTLRLFVMVGVLLSTTGAAMAQHLEKVTALCDSAAVVAASSKLDAVRIYEEALDLAEKLGEKGAEIAGTCRQSIRRLYLDLGNEWLAENNPDRAV